MEFFFFLIAVAIVMAVAIVLSFIQGCRRYYIDRVAWLCSQSLLALFRCRRLWCKNYFAFSLNKREASPESRNRWIHASLSP